MRTDILSDSLWRIADTIRPTSQFFVDHMLCAGLVALTRTQELPEGITLERGALLRARSDDALPQQSAFISPLYPLKNASDSDRQDAFTVVKGPRSCKDALNELCSQYVRSEALWAGLVERLHEALAIAWQDQPSITRSELVRGFVETVGELYRLSQSQTAWSQESTLLPAVGEILVTMATTGRIPHRVYYPCAADSSLLWNSAWNSSEVWFQRPSRTLIAKARLILSALEYTHVWAETDPVTNPPTRDGRLEKFDLSVITPPFETRTESNTWSRHLQIDPRLDYLVDETTPIEFLHLIHGLESTCSGQGTALAIMSAGAMFKGGSAERIRSSILCRAPVQLRTVIALARGFTYPSIPVSLLVFGPRNGDASIRFIDATGNEVGSGRGKQYELNWNNLQVLLDSQSDIPGLLAIRSMDEVLEGECSWDVRRYVERPVPGPFDPSQAAKEAIAAVERTREARQRLTHNLEAEAKRRASNP